MRTTFSIDPDVEMLLAARSKATGRSMKDILNDALRIGLNTPLDRPPALRFEVRPHALQLRPGIDPTKLNQLFDEIEIEEFLDKPQTKAAHA